MKLIITLKSFIRRYFSPWGLQLLHVVAFILLISHIVPEDLIKEWKKEGYLALFFLTSGLIVALIINLWLYVLNRRDLEEKENNFKSIREELKGKISFLDKSLKIQERKIRYSEIFGILNYAFSELHNSIRIKENSKEAHLNAFKNFCTKVSQAFETVTQEKCHVCIKLVTKKSKKSSEKKSNFIVRTFVRDNLNTHRQMMDKNNDIEHRLADNTGINYIFENIRTEKGRFFFSNNLASIEDYSNPSFLRHGNSLTYFPPNTSINEKEEKWPLQYLSVIKTPICLGIANSKTESILLGILAIDCEKKDIFINGIDTEILSGCADGLFNPLINYLELFDNELKHFNT